MPEKFVRGGAEARRWKNSYETEKLRADNAEKREQQAVARAESAEKSIKLLHRIILDMNAGLRSKSIDLDVRGLSHV